MRNAGMPSLYSNRVCKPFAAILLLALGASAQDTKYPPDGQQIPGPPSREAAAEWLSEIARYRAERRVRAGLTGEIYARPELGAIVADLRSQGLHGVGQSSWGPTLYAFSTRPPEEREQILERTRSRFDLPEDSLFWTQASPEGCLIERISEET